mgnify:CR=1 FL=1
MQQLTAIFSLLPAPIKYDKRTCDKRSLIEDWFIG